MYKRDYAKFQADSFVKNCLDVTCNLRHEKLSSIRMYLKVNNIPLVLVHLTISINIIIIQNILLFAIGSNSLAYSSQPTGANHI